VERLEYCLEPDVVPTDGIPDGVFVGETEIVLTCAVKDTRIRYTLDGTEPTPESALYEGPIRIRENCTLHARAFRTKGGETVPIGRTAVIKRTQTQFLEAVAVKNAENGLDYTYFEGDWSALPDFSNLQPVRTGTCGRFVMQPHREDSFAFRFAGFIRVETDGIYSFHTISDDGSRLWVGDRLVVDNDGLHAPEQKAGQIALKAGFHPITVAMFEKDGGEELDVLFSGPGMSPRRIPEEALFRR
jgi:hypothetical protein